MEQAEFISLAERVARLEAVHEIQLLQARWASTPHIGLLTGYDDVDYIQTAEGWRIQRRVERLVFNREETYYVPVESEGAR
jgi:hypothetical protein